MAHLGHNYKLQFRRDLTPFPENIIGWPEAFIYQPNGLQGIFGSQINLHKFLCVDLLTDIQPPMVWTSDPYTIAGHTWTVVLSVASPSIPTTPPTTEMKLVIGEATQGVVVRDRLQIFYPPTNSDGLHGSVPIDFIAPGYGDPTKPVGFGVHPARWADYNP